MAAARHSERAPQMITQAITPTLVNTSARFAADVVRFIQ